MANPVAETPARNDIELPSAVHWPTVYAMAGIGGGLAVVLLAVALVGAAQGPPAPQSAAPAAPVAVVAPPTRHAAPTVQPAAPVETAPADSGPPVWKPLVPHPAPVQMPALPIAHPTDVKGPPEASIKTSADSTPTLAPSAPIPPFQRIDLCNDYQLLAVLEDRTPAVDLDTVEGAAAKLLASDDGRRGKDGAKNGAKKAESAPDVIARRPDLAGLPVRGESECRLAAKSAEAVETISRGLRRFRPGPGARSRTQSGQSDLEPDVYRGEEMAAFLAKQKEWRKDECVPVLVQMLQIEGPLVRQELTKTLAGIKGPRATVALARRALFDLSPALREGAVQALQERSPEEYRQTLLDGLRYPWAPVANHAAEALTALEDRGAVPRLEAMLALPDPSAPQCNEDQKWVVPELVKVNHLRNCLLCHAPSQSTDDHVRGLVPKPGEELPPEYYERRGGDFVRADVTYLRQDFSVVERVANPDKWPDMQRFDYMVRQRALTDQERIDLADVGPKENPSYPQREAVRFALEALKSRDPNRPLKTVGLGP